MNSHGFVDVVMCDLVQGVETLTTYVSPMLVAIINIMIFF